MGFNKNCESLESVNQNMKDAHKIEIILLYHVYTVHPCKLKIPRSGILFHVSCLTCFTRAFFAHYFPDIVVGEFTFLDKEFISKYEALKESLKDDLFLIMEIEVSGVTQDVVIQIEHKSNREDVSERILSLIHI